jgi:AraC-like DNA-binding protein
MDKLNRLILLTLLTSCSLTGFGQNRSNSSEDNGAFRDSALAAVERMEYDRAVYYLDKQIKSELDLQILTRAEFRPMRGYAPFDDLVSRYVARGRPGPMIYLYAGLIGFFIVIMFNLQPKRDKLATGLLSMLIFIHAFFIIHVGMYAMNYQYGFPHLYSTSTAFAFLYGPLLYLYFRRIKTGASLDWKDGFHLLPTLILIGLFVPVFVLSGEDKLRIMLGVGPYVDREYGVIISVGKLISLLAYTLLTLKLYRQSERNKVNHPRYREVLRWQSTLVGFQTAFTIIYGMYLLALALDLLVDPLFHLQLSVLSALVLYVAYMAFRRPETLLGYKLEESFNKYRNSGLTESFSEELRDDLLSLLEKEQVFRQNDINLNTVAERLGTTRHNTSQVINEHFGVSFFELINKYRIEEAMRMLRESQEERMNIIDVAYEVGYNNKVTFNKSFKKINEMTPSQYLKKVRQSAGQN